MFMHQPIFCSNSILVSDGARICFQIIRTSRKKKNYKILVVNSIQYNSYFSHSENIIISMIGDTNLEIRRKGIQYIIEARKNRNNIIRKFEKPNINFNANNYYEMIDFKCVFESILTYKYTNEDLDTFLKEEFFPILFSYPCHSQVVERRIKDITTSSLKLNKPEERDGMYINVINYRKIMLIKREFLM